MVTPKTQTASSDSNMVAGPLPRGDLSGGPERLEE